MTMKVKHKQGDGDFYEVLEETDKYFIVKDGFSCMLALDKKDFEPVQEWVPLYSFEMCGMKGKEIRAVHSGHGFITVEVKK